MAMETTCRQVDGSSHAGVEQGQLWMDLERLQERHMYYKMYGGVISNPISFHVKGASLISVQAWSTYPIGEFGRNKVCISASPCLGRELP